MEKTETKQALPTGKIITCITELYDYELEELRLITGLKNKNDLLREAVLFTIENRIRIHELEKSIQNEKTMR